MHLYNFKYLFIKININLIFRDRFRTTLNIVADALGAGIITHYYKKNTQTSIQEEEMELYIST